MADYATKQDVEKIVKKAVDDLSEVIAQLAQNVHDELAGIRGEIAELRGSMNSLINTIDGFLKRLDDIEADNVARDVELARMKRWIEQIAKQTGVKLDY